MAKASINFKPVKSNSTMHNERTHELDYVYSDLSKNNESWKVDDISNRYDQIAQLTKEKTGRKIQAKATPIREAVVNLNSNHTLFDLQQLAGELKEKKGIECFQIYIHRDEGKSRQELNYHAHMVFDWQDKASGKSYKLNRQDMSEIQSLVSDVLDMERGELKENSNRERLEPIEYKRQQEEKRLKSLQLALTKLEQKKNRAIRINERAKRKYSRFKTLSHELVQEDAIVSLSTPREAYICLREGIKIQQRYIANTKAAIGEIKMDEKYQRFTKEIILLEATLYQQQVEIARFEGEYKRLKSKTGF